MTRSRHSFTVRDGPVKVRVWRNYTLRAGQRVLRWEFRYRDEQGRRRSIKRKVKEQARAEARAMARRIAERTGAPLTILDTAALHAVNTNLYGLGVSADVATFQYRQAREQLAAIDRDSIEEAIKFYVEHHRGGNSDMSLAGIVAELLQVRARAGDGRRHLGDLRSRLQRFAREAHCRLADVTTPIIDKWLDALTTERRTRRNYRAALVTLFAFARDRGYVPAGFDPMKGVPVPKVGKPKKGVFKPEEMKRLLAHCSDKLLPVLAIGSFAGLRQSEVLLLDWSDVHWNESRIRVPEEGKTGGRYAPLHPNLRAWLEPVRAAGPVVKLSSGGISKAIVRTVAKANRELAGQSSRERVKWPHNGPRHSYASYRCATTRNVGLVADEMGHSVSELARSYRNQKVTCEEAEAWFAIVPERASNVLEFDFARQFGSPEAPSNIAP